MKKSIGERILAVRTEANMSQRKFADLIGISGGSVSMIETGVNNPSDQTLKLICNEFGVSYDWLKNGDGEPYRNTEDRITAKVVSLLAGEPHEKTKALIRALARLDDSQLNAIDKYVDYLLEELGD